MRIRSLLLSVLGFCLSAVAQTPGNAGVNDFWPTPGGSPGGISCRGATMLTPLTMTFNVSANPSVAYVIFLSTCPCSPCGAFPAMPSSPCVTPATTSCGANQFLELLPACPILALVSGTTSGTGSATIPINVPLTSPPVKLAFQTVFLGPPACVVAPWNLLFSQAWDIGFF